MVRHSAKLVHGEPDCRTHAFEIDLELLFRYQQPRLKGVTLAVYYHVTLTNQPAIPAGHINSPRLETRGVFPCLIYVPGDSPDNLAIFGIDLKSEQVVAVDAASVAFWMLQYAPPEIDLPAGERTRARAALFQSAARAGTSGKPLEQQRQTRIYLAWRYV